MRTHAPASAPAVHTRLVRFQEVLRTAASRPCHHFPEAASNALSLPSSILWRAVASRLPAHCTCSSSMSYVHRRGSQSTLREQCARLVRRTQPSCLNRRASGSLVKRCEQRGKAGQGGSTARGRDTLPQASRYSGPSTGARISRCCKSIGCAQRSTSIAVRHLHNRVELVSALTGCVVLGEVLDLAQHHAPCIMRGMCLRGQVGGDGAAVSGDEGAV